MCVVCDRLTTKLNILSHNVMNDIKTFQLFDDEGGEGEREREVSREIGGGQDSEDDEDDDEATAKTHYKLQLELVTCHGIVCVH